MRKTNYYHLLAQSKKNINNFLIWKLPCLIVHIFFIQYYLNSNTKYNGSVPILLQGHRWSGFGSSMIMNYSLAHFHYLVWCLRSQHLAKIYVTNNYPPFVLSCCRIPEEKKNQLLSLLFENCIYIHVQAIHTGRPSCFLFCFIKSLRWTHTTSESDVNWVIKYLLEYWPITESYLVSAPSL